MIYPCYNCKVTPFVKLQIQITNFLIFWITFSPYSTLQIVISLLLLPLCMPSIAYACGRTVVHVELLPPKYKRQKSVKYTYL